MWLALTCLYRTPSVQAYTLHPIVQSTAPSLPSRRRQAAKPVGACAYSKHGSLTIARTCLVCWQQLFLQDTERPSSHLNLSHSPSSLMMAAAWPSAVCRAALSLACRGRACVLLPGQARPPGAVNRHWPRGVRHARGSLGSAQSTTRHRPSLRLTAAHCRRWAWQGKGVFEGT